MRRRHKIPPKKSKKSFSKNANRTHKFNLQSGTTRVMRGGIRL